MNTGFSDPDMLLLMNEKCDHSLILALVYIIAV